MIKDREQKHRALRLSVANRWFPQLEVNVEPDRAIRERAGLVTDLDVLSSIPDEFRGFRTVIFDCKTSARESAVNRALWLRGVMDRMTADAGFCIVKKELIEIDHRLAATRLGVILLAEDEFDLYGKVTCPSYQGSLGYAADIDVWDQFFAIPSRFSKLRDALEFLRSGYWMITDAAEACRKALAMLRNVRAELDPSKPEHIALFFDFCALFARSLAIVTCHVFRAHLQPSTQAGLSEALLVMLYGGREAYEHRNDLFRLLKSKRLQADAPGLSLPEWERFLNLARQLLDAPVEAQQVPLILREVGFSALRSDTSFAFAGQLCTENRQAAKFAIFIPDYLCKAAKLPPEFAKAADDIIIPLQPVK